MNGRHVPEAELVLANIEGELRHAIDRSDWSIVGKVADGIATLIASLPLPGQDSLFDEAN